ncbi:MAG: PAS domain S-box protein, partial [Anaerolineales bacterium]
MTEISRQNHYHGEKGKALPLDDLRRKVEHVLADQSLSTGEFPLEDVEHLLNELLARQIELMDNLHTSEERFRAIAQTTSEANIIIDSQGKIIFWNNASESIFGYQNAEVIGKSLSIIMPEQFRKDHKNGFERVVNTGKSHIIGSTVKMTALRKDGVEFPIDLSLSSWKSNGEIFFSGIIRDTTESKSAERGIQSLARFPSENLNPVLRASTAGTILYANHASQPLLNLWQSAVGQQLPDPLSELIAEVFSSSQSHTTEVDC